MARQAMTGTEEVANLTEWTKPAYASDMAARHSAESLTCQTCGPGATTGQLPQLPQRRWLPGASLPVALPRSRTVGGPSAQMRLNSEWPKPHWCATHHAAPLSQVRQRSNMRMTQAVRPASVPPWARGACAQRLS